jgi:hypothetical protein
MRRSASAFVNQSRAVPLANAGFPPIFIVVSKELRSFAMSRGRARAKAKAIDLTLYQRRLAFAAVSAFSVISLLLLIRP